MSFTIGSLFDGSGGFPLAASMCGGTPKWASEIEPYPIAVTKSRFPDVKHLGSVTDIKGGEVEPVDVITFGSPCQDLSVAGKRAGLKHTDNGDDETTRSGLFMEAVRIIKEMREATNGVYPRFAVWENVPGAFSSNKGEDFRIVLEELIKVVEPTAVMPEVPKNGWPYADSYCGDGWSLAYRVLDAQFWGKSIRDRHTGNLLKRGTPQRRRRIYLVADFRGECAGKVSFECEGLRGYFETGRTPWQTVAGDAEAGSGAADCERDGVNILNPWDSQGNQVHDGTGNHIYPCLRGCGGAGYQAGYVFAIDQQGGKGGANYAEDVMPTLCSDSHGTPHAVAYSINHQGGNVEQIIEEKTGTLTAAMNSSSNNKLSVAYTLEPGIAAREGGHIYEGVSGCLRANAGDNQMAVAYSFDSLASNSMKSSNPHSGCRQVDVSKCLDTTDPNPSKNQGGIAIVERVGIIYNIGGQAERGWEGEVCPCLKASHYKFAPCVAVPVAGFCTEHSAQARGIDRADTAGCNGKGVKEDICYTLNTIDRPAVAYWDGGQTMATLTANNAGGNQRMPDKENFNCVIESHVVDTDVGWLNSEDDTSPTLLARMYKDPHLVTYGVDARNATEYPEMTGALQADAAHNLNSDNVVRIQYIVRRLTPTECARLQGFPDTWGHPVEKTEFTDEEYQFWLNVRNTHAAINDKATKEYTKDQILKWYNGLHTDSSEYKMWGNGIALPNALYVMQGIADVMSEEKASRRKWLNDLLGDCL